MKQGRKQWGVHARDSFRERRWVGGEWKDNITGREKKERGRKKTDKERRKEGARARGGGGESSEIRVTLRLSGTCSAYKLKEKPKVCHWVISPLSTSWGLGLDSDRVGADSAGPLCSHSSAWHASLSQRTQSRINMQQPLTPAHTEFTFQSNFHDAGKKTYLFIYSFISLFIYLLGCEGVGTPITATAGGLCACAPLTSKVEEQQRLNY